MVRTPASPLIKAYSYVRMSTDAQLKGDSLRRQLDKSRLYAAQNKLVLVEDTELKDIGVSAFKGANAESGALGTFLEAVRAGKIERGSYLLVESLDRISRQPPMIALRLFMELMSNGIVLVTLSDSQVYTDQTTDLQQLIISIVVMSRAHEESATKSQRVTAAWNNKRAQIHNAKLTTRGPAWLQFNSKKKEFDVDKKRAAVIRRIFDDTVAGMGGYTIARRLNAEGVETFGGSRAWQMSSVNKIVTSPAVIGEFQLHKAVDGRRVKDGEPIKNYFPAVVSEEQFYSAQAARLTRRTNGGGRKGKFVTNLFAKIAECAYCGGRMMFEDKGKGPKGGAYLTCMSLKSGLPCISQRWRYRDFETSFLAFVEELDLGSLFPAEEEMSKRSELESRVNSLTGRRMMAEQEREAAYELISKGVSVEFVSQKLRVCENTIVDLSAALDEARNEVALNASTANRYYEEKEMLQQLINRVRNNEGADAFKDRALIAARLKVLIKELKVSSVGYRQVGDQIQKALDEEDLEPEVREDFENLLEFHSMPESMMPYFDVRFHNNITRTVFPDPNDPLRYRQQVVGDDDEAEMIYPSGKRARLPS